MIQFPLGPRTVFHTVILRLGLLAVLAFGVAQTLWAQTTYVPTVPDNSLTPADPVGVPPHASSAGTNEAVNLSSGSLSVFIPVLSVPQRGGWNLTLGYYFNSNTYALQQNVSVTSASTDEDGEVFWGDYYEYTETMASQPHSVGINLPRLRASIEYVGDTKFYNGTGTQTGQMPVFCVTGFVFIDWSGNQHPLSARTECNTSYGNLPSGYFTGGGGSLDGSNLTISWTTLSDIQVTTESGTVYNFTNYVVQWPSANCPNPGCTYQNNNEGIYDSVFSSMTDLNGNTLTTQLASGTFPVGAKSLTDTIGRTITFPTSGGISYLDSNGETQTVTYSATLGSSQQYTFPSFGPGYYNGPTYKYGFSNPTVNTANPAITIYPATVTIALPAVDSTGTKRTYALQLDDLDRLTQINYPAGGYTKYSYQLAGSPLQVMGQVSIPVPLQEIAQKRECTTSAGNCSSSQELVTTYAPTTISGGSSPYNVSITATDPTNAYVVHKFVNTSIYPQVAPRENEADVYSSSGTLLRTTDTVWVGNASAYGDYTAPGTITTIFQDVSPSISWQEIREYNSAIYDNPTEIDDYNFGNTTTPMKKTAIVWFDSTVGNCGTGVVFNRVKTQTVTDPATGNYEETSYTCDSGGNIASKGVTGTGESTTFTTSYLRDAYGDITQVTDPNNNVTKYGYTDTWNQSTCAPPSNSSAYLTSITDALTHVTKFSYDSCSGLKASVTDPNSATTTYSFDGLGRPVTTTRPDTGTTTDTYVDSIPNSVSASSSITSTLNKVQETILDGFGRKIQTQLTSDPDGTDHVDTTYDSLGRVASVSNPYRSTSDSTYGITSYEYDTLNRTLQVTEPDGSNSVVTTTYSGNTTTVTDEAKKTRKSQTDALGRLTNVWEDPSGLNYLTSYGVDAFGNVTGVTQNGSRARGFSYNGLSQLVSATNPESNQVTYTYDNDGNLLTKTGYLENQKNSTPTQATGSVTINGISECLNGVCKTGTISITVNGFEVSTSYGDSTDASLASALASELNVPSSPVTATAPSSTVFLTSKATGPSANYSLSANASGSGKFTVSTSGSTLTGGANPPTVTTTYTYDALNRLTKKTYTDGTPTLTYWYDGSTPSGCSPNPTLTITNGIYRRTAMCDSTGSEEWSYDPMGRVLFDQRTTSNVPYTTSYVYSPYLDGSIYQLKYPVSGRTITFTTGGAGLPTSAVDSANSINYATNAHYTSAGTLAYLQNGTNLYSTLVYNDRLQPCWMYATTGTALPWNSTLCGGSATTGSILDLKYNFNLGAGDNGNVIGITNDRDSTRSQTLAYDSLNRIATAGTVNTSGTNCWGETYGIDAWANLSSLALPSIYSTSCGHDTPFSYTIGNNNQLPSGSGFTYDAAGNLMASGTGSYAHNAENQMTSADVGGVTTTYSYDGDGRRVQKSSGTIYWYGVGDDALDETNLSGSLTNEYVLFGGQRIARRDSSGNVYYYFADHLGTSREIVQAAQTTACYDADFYPYGGEIVHTNSCTTSQSYKFTHKERDSESGLDNFGARFYNSGFGRFMSPDWEAKATAVPYADFGDPQTLNLYGYVRNNPLSKTDLDGHCYPACTVAVGALAGAVIGGGAEIISEKMQGKSVNWKQVRGSAVKGAISGAAIGLAGPEAGVVTTAALGAAGNVVGGVADRTLQGDTAKEILSPKELAKDAASGAIGGGIGGGKVGENIGESIAKGSAEVAAASGDQAAAKFYLNNASVIGTGVAKAIDVGQGVVEGYNHEQPQPPPPPTITPPNPSATSSCNSQGGPCQPH